MNDRDRLAADLLGMLGEWAAAEDDRWADRVADRLIALGWTRLDEERLARALRADDQSDDGNAPFREQENVAYFRRMAAAIAKAYREDEG